MESALNPQRASAIRDQAADWLLACQEGLNAVQMRQFARWLATSPEHLAEYHAMQRLDRDLPLALNSAASAADLLERVRVAEDGQDRVVQVARADHGGHAIRYRNPPLALAAALAVMAVALAVLWPRLTDWFAPQAHELRFTAAHGQLLTQRLEDGTVLHLDTDSAVVVRYSTKGRQVQLQRGRATFEVEHDAARPFEVFAGAARMVDVGTKFDVYLLPDATLVTVIEGRVEVSELSAQGASGSVLLGAGQQIRVAAGESLAGPTAVDTGKVTAYLRRTIIFEHQPLAAVAEEFNRYSLVPISITSPELGRVTITGSLAVDDLDSFIAYLRAMDGVHVEISPTSILVSKN
jgi:transmembrane sensor